MTDLERLLKELEEATEAKRREIQAAGLCEWRYRVAPKPGWIQNFAAWWWAQWGE